MSAETWRVVLAAGEVRDVVLTLDRRTWVADAGAQCFRNEIPVYAVADMVRFGFQSIAIEILAPGEPTRAEAVAAARRAGAEAMRDACDDALDGEERRHRSAERDVKAKLEELATAWERGAAIESARDVLRALPLPGEGSR